MRKELAVGYCRVSSKKQKDMGLSLDAQEDYIKEHCKTNGHDLVKIFKFDEKASAGERKHLKSVFRYCLENGIKQILITDLDRWTRDRDLDSEARKYLQKNGLSVYLIRERRSIPEFSSANEKFAHHVTVDAANYVADIIREKVLTSQEQKLKKSEFPGLPPIGYKSIPKTKNSPQRIVQTEDAEKMKMFLETFSSGKFSAHQAVRLARDLGLNNKSGKGFTRPQLGKIIKNRFYYGEFVWSHPWIDDGEQKVYENKTQGFKPLISKETWKKNCAILRDRQKNFRKKRLSFKYNDLMTCGKCRRKIYGAQFKYKVGDKRYTYSPYYLCTKGPWYTIDGLTVIPEEYVDKDELVIKEDVFTTSEEGKKQLWLKEGTKVEKRFCQTPSFKEAEIEQMLLDEFALIKFNGDHWEEIKESLFQDETKDFIDNEITMLKTEQSKSDSKLDRLYNDYCEGIIDAEFFKSRSGGIRDRLAEIKDRLAELEEERLNFDTRIGKSIETLDAMQNWNDIIKNASDEKKHQLIRLLTTKIETVHDKVERNGKIFEHKGLEFSYSPEVRALFELGILEAAEKDERATLPEIGREEESLVVEKLGISGAPLKI